MKMRWNRLENGMTLWTTGLLFLFANYTFMEDVLYRKFFNLSYDNTFYVLLLAIAAYFFGQMMQLAGKTGYEIYKKRFSKKMDQKASLYELIETLSLTEEDKRASKIYKKWLSRLDVLLTLFGLSLSCLVLFLIKLLIEIRFYNYSNIQYVILFLGFSYVLLRELDKFYDKIQLVAVACSKKLSDK